MSAEGTRKAIIAAFLANLGIALSKFFAFAVTGSASMLAEAIHSVADTGNQGLLFLGGKRSHKAPTDEHPFGFGTERDDIGDDLVPEHLRQREERLHRVVGIADLVAPVHEHLLRIRSADARDQHTLRSGA